MPSRLTVVLGEYRSQLSELNTSTIVQALATGGGALAVLMTLLEAPATQMAIGASAARALLLDSSAVLSLLVGQPRGAHAPPTPPRTCAPIIAASPHAALEASPDVQLHAVASSSSGIDGAATSDAAGSEGEPARPADAINASAVVDGCTPLCSYAQRLAQQVRRASHRCPYPVPFSPRLSEAATLIMALL